MPGQAGSGAAESPGPPGHGGYPASAGAASPPDSGAVSPLPFDLQALVLEAAGARNAEEIAARAASGAVVLAALEGDFRTALKATALFLGEGRGAEGADGGPGPVLRARLCAEALGDPSCDAAKLVGAVSPSGKRSGELMATALASSLRGAADLGRIQKAEERFRELWEMEDPGGSVPALSYVKARGACMLMELYGERLMFDGLQGVFKTADVLENRRDVAAEKFRASVRIIAAYAGGGELGPAMSLYRPLEYLEGLGEFNRLRAAAAASLSAAFAERGVLAEARALYAVQTELWNEAPVPETADCRDPLGILDALTDPLGCYEREVFRFEEDAGLEQGMWVDRARAAAAMMEGYAETGETEEAMAVHVALMIPGQVLLPPGLSLVVAMGLFNACLKSGELESAKEVFRKEALEMPPADAIQEGRASMAGALMAALAARGDLDGARSVYDAVEFPGDGPKARQARAYLSGMMASLLSEGGQPGKASRLVRSPRFAEDCRGYPQVAARSSLELAESFLRKGSFDEARDICQSGALELGGRDVGSGKAMVMSSAISRLCLDGKLDEARRLFEELPEGRRSRKSAIYRVMASMSLRDAYSESGNAEGLEFIRRCVEGFSALEARLYNRSAGMEDDGKAG